MELLTDQRPVRMIACPTLSYEHDRIDRLVPHGLTIAGHLRTLGWNPETVPLRIFLGDRFIERLHWDTIIPRAGQVLIARAVPGTGDGGKSALRIVAMLGVVVAAIATQQYWAVGLADMIGVSAATAGAIGVAGASVAGSLAVTGTIPPARPRRGEVSHG